MSQFKALKPRHYLSISGFDEEEQGLAEGKVLVVGCLLLEIASEPGLIQPTEHIGDDRGALLRREVNRLGGSNGVVSFHLGV